MNPPRSEDVRNETVLPVIEEQLEVSRRRVETGAVRVRKVVHEDIVDLNRHHVTESVVTERVSVGRIVQGPQPVRQEGDTLVVPVVQERLVVHKELVLVEEVRITRRRDVRQVPDEVKLRRESAVVERLDPATGRWHAAEEAPAPPPQDAPS